MARKSESEALPNTSMARSNILNLNALTNTLRNTTPPNSAHTNLGRSNRYCLSIPSITSANERQAANMARVSMAEVAVIKRVCSARSNILSVLS